MDMPNAGAGAPPAGAAPAEGLEKGGNTDPKAVNPTESKPGDQAPAQKFKFKFQIDGQEVEEEYDEATLKSTLQKAKGADKRFQEANATQQKIARMVEMMKTPEGLEKLLAHPNMYGPKARQVLEELLWKQIQREQMDPKERENLELREKLRAKEEAEKQAAEQQRREEFERTKKGYAEQIDKEIVEAIKAAGQPVTPYFFKRVAHYMLSALQQGKQVAPKDVVPLVQEDLQNDLRSMFESTTEDQILAFLKSDKAWENIRKADLKRVKLPINPVNPQPPAPKPEDKKKIADPNELTKRTSIFDW